MIIMETERLTLRPWLYTDADALFRYASEPDIGNQAGWPPHKSVDESREIIRTVFSSPTVWAIVLKETGEPIGSVGYMESFELNIPARPGEAMAGYWVAKPYWNKGICTEALAEMIRHIRETTQIPSLICCHFADNPASGRVMEKCGFIPTGEISIDDNQHGGKNRPMRILRLEF